MCRSFVYGALEQIIIKTLPVLFLNAQGAAAPVNGGYPLFGGRALDMNIAPQGVENIGLNASLYHFRRNSNSFDSKLLHKVFGNNPPAPVTTGRTFTGKILGFENGNIKPPVNHPCHLQCKDAEQCA